MTSLLVDKVNKIKLPFSGVSVVFTRKKVCWHSADRPPRLYTRRRKEH